MTPEDWARMFAAQAGRCYLCGCELDTSGASRSGPTSPHLDHVHDHCGPKKTCAICRRGIACAPCNLIVGWAKDDPDLLVRIADALRTANVAARARIAAAPAVVQGELFS
jgi:hypothetical protein